MFWPDELMKHWSTLLPHIHDEIGCKDTEWLCNRSQNETKKWGNGHELSEGQKKREISLSRIDRVNIAELNKSINVFSTWWIAIKTNGNTPKRKSIYILWSAVKQTYLLNVTHFEIQSDSRLNSIDCSMTWIRLIGNSEWMFILKWIEMSI